jgi:hypothetical protein
LIIKNVAIDRHDVEYTKPSGELRRGDASQNGNSNTNDDLILDTSSIKTEKCGVK